MTIFNVFILLIVLAAFFSYFNVRYLHIPSTIGMIMFSLVLSLVLILLDYLGLPLKKYAQNLLGYVNFRDLLLNIFLSFLLFAGALTVNLDDLLPQKGTILSLATLGVVLSTFIVGGIVWLILSAFHTDVPILYCFLFGALISPTDPVAVLSLMKSVGAGKRLEALVSGESLFNDGIGVIVFLTLENVALRESGNLYAGVGIMFARQVAGGILFGLAAGFLAYQMLKRVDEYKSEILITLALVMGGYAVAEASGVSGPLAMVVSGLLIGNPGRAFAMSEKTRESLDLFWELIDNILNALLFILIGLEMLVLDFKLYYLLIGAFIIPAVLISRWVSVAPFVHIFRKEKEYHQDLTTFLTWGGLRGGIAIALALSLPDSPYRDPVISITYLVVIFSILVQGLTLRRTYFVLRRKHEKK